MDLHKVSKNETAYTTWLGNLKQRIQTKQMRAVQSVNSELIKLYWEIGHSILEKQQQQKWGTKVIDRLARDLRAAFPEMKGFSPSNLKYMRRFAEAYPECKIGQQPADQLPWFHNIVLLTQVPSLTAREWYAIKTIEHGWSRNVLGMQIETGLFEREGKAISNFSQRLPAPQSDLVTAVLKDPYVFDFLGLSQHANDRSIENALVDQIVRFLLELGTGFSFVGHQIHVEIGGEDFFIDLLFYHLKLRCYVVVELKATAFKPEYTGQLNFYLAAVDTELKHPQDHPTIGLLLCKKHNRIVAEYSLRNISSPIGISEYLLTEVLPKELETSLPSIEQIEIELKQNH
ncbi:MAG: PDDEXK nuclease domain-containing protein [Chthoniobacterales bacterium]|nr:PDDEXK nuclease domain-containing protein [Chthoniobacterales bacterium]